MLDYFAMRRLTFVFFLCITLFAQKHGAPGVTTIAELNNPYGLTIGPDGALYVCEIGNHVVQRVDLKTLKTTVVAGQYGKKGYSGDGGLATEALLTEPYEVRFAKNGDMYFVEMQNHVVRKVDHATKLISTVAGTGAAGFGGDGGPATKAQFRQPHSIAFDAGGGLLVCDIGNHRIRRIDLASGTIDTYCGTGEKKPTPDGAAIKGTPLNGPRAIDVDTAGNLYVALREGNAIYRIDPKADRISHVAGTGEKGYSGDAGPAKLAKFSGPKGLALAPDGSLYIADTENHAIRRLDLKTGVITTVAGTGVRGDGPDGDPLKCQLARPHGVFVDRRGIVFIDDSESNKVRRLQ